MQTEEKFSPKSPEVNLLEILKKYRLAGREKSLSEALQKYKGKEIRLPVITLPDGKTVPFKLWSAPARNGLNACVKFLEDRLNKETKGTQAPTKEDEEIQAIVCKLSIIFLNGALNDPDGNKKLFYADKKKAGKIKLSPKANWTRNLAKRLEKWREIKAELTKSKSTNELFTTPTKAVETVESEIELAKEIALELNSGGTIEEA